MLDKIRKTENYLLGMTLAWKDMEDRWALPELRDAIIEVNSTYEHFKRARAAYEKMEIFNAKREEK